MSDSDPLVTLPYPSPQPAPASSAPARDPLLLALLALLAVLTVLAGFLYRTAPQSAAEAGNRALVAVAPDAFTPRLARARERIGAALRARAAGDTAGAIARYAEAEEEALTARQQTADSARARVASELWAGAALDRAELMLAAGARPWFRADDQQVLGEALAVVQRVQTAPLLPPTRARAAELEQRIRRALRPGPLEWIPR